MQGVHSTVTPQKKKKNQKKWNFSVKNGKKLMKMSPKIQKNAKNTENQAKNKLLSKHNKYRTLVNFITINLNVL